MPFRVYGIYHSDTLVYIGATTKGLKTRLGGHYAHNLLISCFMHEKGRDSFTISSLKECDSRIDMINIEKQMIKTYQPLCNVKDR